MVNGENRIAFFNLNEGTIIQMTTPLPPNWGKDSLSEFLETARHNTIATFVNCSNEYKTLKTIHVIFNYVKDNLNHTPEWFTNFFFFKVPLLIFRWSKILPKWSMLGDLHGATRLHRIGPLRLIPI